MAPCDRGPGAAKFHREAHPIYSMSRVDTFLSFIGLVFYVVLVIGLAAAVTALVVRISPTKDVGEKSP